MMQRLLLAWTIGIAVLIGQPALAQQVVTLGISKAEPTLDDFTGQPVLTVWLDAKGQAAFTEFTASHVGKQADLMIDGQVVSSPVVQTVINTPSLVITGNFTMAEVTDLARQLNSAGAEVIVRGPGKIKVK